jgi:hypothetical protein
MQGNTGEAACVTAFRPLRATGWLELTTAGLRKEGCHRRDGLRLSRRAHVGLIGQEPGGQEAPTQALAWIV